MRTLSGSYAAHTLLGSTTVADFLRIERTDGAVYAFTSHVQRVKAGGEWYEAEQGLMVSSIVASAGLAVDNLELTTLDDGTTFTHVDVHSGIWRNARFAITRRNYLAPDDGHETRMAGTIGNVFLRRGTVAAELRGWQQWLQQPVGSVTTQNCRARLGDANCRKDLTSFTHAATVTSKADNQTFTATALTQDADYFGNGLLHWDTGPSAGTWHHVKAHAAGGVLTLMLPMLVEVEVGHQFTAIAGCRKRHERTAANPSGVSDCIDKFNNVINFYGEPHLPGTDRMTSPP